MEIRKVQITGGSSFVITLPKEWAKRHNLQKNEPLGLINQPNGNLLLTPRISEEKTERTKEFEVYKDIEPSHLKRLLIGAYIGGYNSIIIRGKRRIPPFVRTVVRDFIQMTIGQEVVEETNGTITLKDLLNPAVMPIHKTIRRMFILVKSMHEDAVTSLVQRRESLGKDVQMRDNEVDRLHWLIARQYNLILRNVTLTEKMGITIEDATTFYLISRIIERIGDHAVRISQHVPFLLKGKIDSRIVKSIDDASNLALELYDKSMKSLLKKDLKGSNESIEEIKELEQICDSINKLALKQKGPLAISIGYVLESLRRIGEYAVNISENVINHIVNEE